MSPFPLGFRWGVATSAYQIEGATGEDGRGPSIWDTFGPVADGSTADVACDHYHRWAEDVDLLGDLGVGAYRFSVAWPRIMPTGSGEVNPKGLSFYDGLVDALLARDIEPIVTLYHWDLPQTLQDAGGWLARDTAARFGDYAEAVSSTLGDRVALWLTLNEPLIHQVLGHLLGLHAPGLTLPANGFPVIHHQLLAHGHAVAALRCERAAAVGIANAYAPAWAVGADGTRETATEADVAAARAYDIVHNRLCTEPLLLGHYPDRYAELFSVDLDAVVRDGDLAMIGAPIDVLGVHYYTPTGIGAPPADDGLPFGFVRLAGFPRTDMDWAVVPEGLHELLVGLNSRYGPSLPPIWVTENGCAYNGLVDDDRVSYFDSHIRSLERAIVDGVDVRGYLAWSLLDNWEWAEGFTRRFGLVHVDPVTGDRTPKTSFAWYRDLVRG